MATKQHNGGFLPGIILLTQCYYHRGTRSNAMKRFVENWIFVVLLLPLYFEGGGAVRKLSVGVVRRETFFDMVPSMTRLARLRADSWFVFLVTHVEGEC